MRLVTVFEMYWCIDTTWKITMRTVNRSMHRAKLCSLNLRCSFLVLGLLPGGAGMIRASGRAPLSHDGHLALACPME